MLSHVKGRKNGRHIDVHSEHERRITEPKHTLKDPKENTKPKTVLSRDLCHTVCNTMLVVIISKKCNTRGLYFEPFSHMTSRLHCNRSQR